MAELHLSSDEPVFRRVDNFVVFNQLGIKLEIDSSISDQSYYEWLDEMIGQIGGLVQGAEIAEKSYARTEPRLNTGVYYDTKDRDLLRLGAVLRTTCNKRTHAFCAFKMPADQHSVRRDHRHVFEGADKASIQEDPRSPISVSTVMKLLTRDDIEHPGIHLLRNYGIRAEELSPSLCIEQYRHPFFVWLDKKDALRCTMDRAYCFDLRSPRDATAKRLFTEVELPVYPRIDPKVAQDSRVVQLINVLSQSLQARFRAVGTDANKYQRAAQTIGIT